jgi:hypothetical protein
MSTKLEFETPEGRLTLSISDTEFLAYDAGDVSMRSMREFVERMRAMGLGVAAERHASLIAQSKVNVMELRETREDAEALLACGESFDDTISPRLAALRDAIVQTQIDLRASMDRMAALSAASHAALKQIRGYRPPARRIV